MRLTVPKKKILRKGKFAYANKANKENNIGRLFAMAIVNYLLIVNYSRIRNR